MADPDLNESAWQRAKDDAAGVYRTTTFQLGGALVAAICSALAVIAQEGQPTTTQGAVLVLAAAVAILLSVVIVLVCQLAAAPIRQRNELREAMPSTPGPIVSISVQLANSYRRGTELLARIHHEPGRPTHDRKAAQNWVEETVNVLAGNVPDETCQKFLSAGGGEPETDRRLDWQVQALKEIIEGLG